MDQHNTLIGEHDLKRQARQTFENLQIALAASGATTKDVIKLTIYVKDYKPADASQPVKRSGRLSLMKTSQQVLG